jgi:hypothetical protein
MEATGFLAGTAMRHTAIDVKLLIEELSAMRQRLR